MEAIFQRFAAAAGLCFNMVVSVLRSPGTVIHYQYLGNVVVFFVHCIPLLLRICDKTSCIFLIFLISAVHIVGS